jgi:hypothetical protein
MLKKTMAVAALLYDVGCKFGILKTGFKKFRALLIFLVLN